MATISEQSIQHKAETNGARGRATTPEVAARRSASTTLDWGNSAPLALFAFAVTTFMLSMVNANCDRQGRGACGVRRRADVRRPHAADRGIIQLRVGNTFAGVLFSGFGAFWLSLFAIAQWFLKDVPPAQVGHALGLFLYALRHLHRDHVGHVAAHKRCRRLALGDPRVRVLLPRGGQLRGSHDADPLGRLHRPGGCRMRVLSGACGAL